jgi:hypothetical protein
VVAGATAGYGAVYSDAGQRWRRGAAGEREVARRLRRLERRGLLLLNDLPRGRGGNVDHLVAGPGGVFTIETKLTRFDKRGLEQARAHARWAERKLAQPVVPILCLARGDLKPRNYGGVWCLGASRLARFLERQPGPSANPAEVADKF